MIQIPLPTRCRNWVSVVPRRKRKMRKMSSSTTLPTTISRPSPPYVTPPLAQITQAKPHRLCLNSFLPALHLRYRWKMIFSQCLCGHAKSPCPRNGNGDSISRFRYTSDITTESCIFNLLFHFRITRILSLALDLLCHPLHLHLHSPSLSPIICSSLRSSLPLVYLPQQQCF